MTSSGSRVGPQDVPYAETGTLINQRGPLPADTLRTALNAEALLGLIQRIVTLANQSVDIDQFLRDVVTDLALTAGFDIGHFYRMTPGETHARSGTWWIRPSLPVAAENVVSLQRSSETAHFLGGIGMPAHVLGCSGPTAFTDISGATPLVRRQQVAAAGLRAVLALPVTVHGRTVAILEFFTRETDRIAQFPLNVGDTLGHISARVFERVEADQDQWALQTHAQLILDNAGDAFIAIDSDGLVLGWNREAERMFGYPASEAIGAFMPDLIMPPEYRAAHDSGIAHYMTTGSGRIEGHYVELEALRKGGKRFPIEMTFWGLRQNDRWLFYSFGRDITDRKAREADLFYRAVHDTVTGLPNRAATVEHLDAVLQDHRAERAGPITVILLDLDRFKLTAERLGPTVTDTLMVEIARRMTRAVGSGRWIARAGDNEFVVIVDDLSPDAAFHLAEQINAALVEPVELRDDQIVMNVSMAIVTVRDAEHRSVDETADDVLRNIAAGLAIERDRNPGRIVVFDAPTRDRIRERLTTERDLATGIAQNQLRLHYQPIVQLDSGRMVGVEALVRWQHPTRGLLAPGAFIEVAEESGLIVPLGSWVIREAVRQAAEWDRISAAPLAVAINLSARQFAQSDLVSDIAGTAQAAGLMDGNIRLMLEVTESMLMSDPDSAIETMRQLRRHGFGIAIDDFGTGYSSLAYLTSFPVSTVKIDRSFVTDIDTDPRGRAVVQAVADLGRALGLTVLAEGIETEAQRARLTAIGCDHAQGYLFHRPMPADAITRQLVAG